MTSNWARELNAYSIRFSLNLFVKDYLNQNSKLAAE